MDNGQPKLDALFRLPSARKDTKSGMLTADQRLEREHWDRVFGAAHDYPNPAPLQLPYLVLSHPRSGSTMLCSSLSLTRLAGTPIEYLNPSSVGTYQKAKGPVPLNTYFNEMVRRRTSPNGRFGMKLMPHQFTAAFQNSDSGGVSFLRSFKRFIRTYRRDKVAQAVSNVLANERKLWTTTNPEDKLPERGFRRGDVVAITAALSYLVSAEQFWIDVIGRLNLKPVIEIAYEDLVADTRREVGRALAHIGVEMPTDEIPLPKTVKLAGEGSREIKRRYLEAIGLGATADAE